LIIFVDIQFWWGGAGFSWWKDCVWKYSWCTTWCSVP